MKGKIAKLVSTIIIIMIALTFSSSAFAKTEGEFATYVKEHKKWFWDSDDIDEGITKKKKEGAVFYFGMDLTPGGSAAKKKNCACLYHLQKSIPRK